MRTLVIGFGEVGSALGSILRDYVPEFLDPQQGLLVNDKTFDIIHVTFPCKDEQGFIDSVKSYQEKFKPKYTVIHSTVPVGVSRKCGAVHSPIRGIHPNLESGIKTFPKFLGGEKASEVADYFRRVGLKVILFDKQETTEAMKLFDTEYYRTCIEFAHRVKKYCDKYDLNFHEVYTLSNQTYNVGYKELGHPEFVRPILQPIMKPIGGHCLLPNAELIKLSE